MKQRVNTTSAFYCCFSSRPLIHILRRRLLNPPLTHSQQRKLSYRLVKHNRQRTNSRHFFPPLIHSLLYTPRDQPSIHNRQQKPLHLLLIHSRQRILFDLGHLERRLGRGGGVSFLSFIFF